MCVDLIVPYKIYSKVNKEYLILKAVTMINPVTGWFKIIKYKDKPEMIIKNLEETTWLTRYPWPAEITHDRGSEFIGH